MPKKPCVGARLDDVLDIVTALSDIRNAGFEFLCSNMMSSDAVRNRIEMGVHPVTQQFSWSDLALPSSEWSCSIVGIISEVLDLLEDQFDAKKIRAQDSLIAELDYCQHLGLPAILMEPKDENYGNLARVIHSRLVAGIHNSVDYTFMKYWVKFPMTFDDADQSSGDSMLNRNEISSSWNVWNKFRILCNTERRLFPVLELPANLPSEAEVLRWLGEPVKCLFLSTRIFTTNSKGYPVLPKGHQNILKRFFQLGTQVVVHIHSVVNAEEHKFFKQYIDYLYGVQNEELDDSGMRHFTVGYEDYLQSPLQPLMDNLESHTYEVFEKDPTKYELYRTAIYESILSRVTEQEKDTKVLVVMVVGAGRGPLVKASIVAAEKANRKIRLYAIEKNINAVNTLLHLKASYWHDQVTVISSDMREWVAPEKADIIVSELLGSFGDNELSPECLDGAQKFLKDDGTMIPQNYTSYLSPIMSPKLWNEVRAFRDCNKHMYSHFETPYVVHMQNRYEIAPPQELFTFKHPNFDIPRTNDRSGTVTFVVEQDSVLHGFAGYFESTLFDGVKMSIHPKTHSKGMFSWFPIYFPLREPLQLRKDNKLTVHFWRCSSKSAVWYEWAVKSPLVVPIHNPNGRSYTIGL